MTNERGWGLWAQSGSQVSAFCPLQSRGLSWAPSVREETTQSLAPLLFLSEAETAPAFPKGKSLGSPGGPSLFPGAWLTPGPGSTTMYSVSSGLGGASTGCSLGKQALSLGIRPGAGDQSTFSVLVPVTRMSMPTHQCTGEDKGGTEGLFPTPRKLGRLPGRKDEE